MSRKLTDKTCMKCGDSYLAADPYIGYYCPRCR